MDDDKNAEIRDLRKKGYFQVDDVLVDEWLDRIGSALPVYLCLCRHSNREGKSFPGRETIARKTGTSVSSVKRAITLLKELNMIEVEQVKSTNNQFKTNRYCLIDKEFWSRGSQVNHGGAVGQNEPIAVGHSFDPLRAHSIYKGTSIKIEQSSKEVEKVLHAFHLVNPVYRSWFPRKAYRNACADLIEQHGLQKVLRLIEALPKINSMPFMPRATTPIELRDKFSHIASSWIQQQQIKKDSEKEIIGL